MDVNFPHSSPRERENFIRCNYHHRSRRNIQIQVLRAFFRIRFILGQSPPICRAAPRQNYSHHFPHQIQSRNSVSRGVIYPDSRQRSRTLSVDPTWQHRHLVHRRSGDLGHETQQVQYRGCESGGRRCVAGAGWMCTGSCGPVGWREDGEALG